MGAVARVQPRVSFADLERAPEDGRRYELYDGEVYVVPAPMPRHQRVQIRLVEWLDDYVECFGGFAVCAPIDIVFSEYDVVQPEVLFFGPAERTWSISIGRFGTHQTCASRSCHRRPRRRTACGRCRCLPDTGCRSTGSSTP
jgi:hypothetical protein